MTGHLRSTCHVGMHQTQLRWHRGVLLAHAGLPLPLQDMMSSACLLSNMCMVVCPRMAKDDGRPCSLLFDCMFTLITFML
jgi:hypothetical protein